MSLVTVACGRGHSPGNDSAVATATTGRNPRVHSLPRPSASVAPSAKAAFPQVEQRVVGGRSYRSFGPGRHAWALTLNRPDRNDPSVLLSVAGTYTSPAGDVEGYVLVDGKPLRERRMAWEGLLRIENGRGTVARKPPGPFPASELSGYRGRRVSLLQGHLLVDDAKPRPLKPSPALQRRAFIMPRSGRSLLVESTAGVELPQFAEDLVALGAVSALNLDMGGWSEGFYRSASGTIERIGNDSSSTSRQSNWLVLKRR